MYFLLFLSGAPIVIKGRIQLMKKATSTMWKYSSHYGDVDCVKAESNL